MVVQVKVENAQSNSVPRPQRKKPPTNTIRRLHGNGPAHLKGQHMATVFLMALWGFAAWTWFVGWWPVTVATWLLAAHLNHMKTIAFHEAAHRLLCARGRLNELAGIMIGTFAMVPLSVYRYAHHSHHAHLGTAKDVELWPFSDPRVSKSRRIMAAVLELSFGVVCTPLLFLRSVLVANEIRSDQMRRIILEYAICAVFWGCVLAAVASNGWWEAFIVGYAIPAAIAASLQTLRKYVEHMGLLGDSPLTLTRTIVAQGLLSRLVSKSLLHNDNHGAHHVYARVPHRRLPETTQLVYESEYFQPSLPIYSSYLHAFMDMIPCLLNPRIGRQWAVVPSGQSVTDRQR